MLITFLVFSIFLNFSVCQQIIYFDSLTPTNTQLGEINKNYSIYVSAQQDSDDLLARIYLTDFLGVKFIASTLKNREDPKGPKPAWKAVGPVTFSTDLSQNDLNSLNGLIYIHINDGKSSQPQVYDLTKSQVMSTDFGGTIVVLNTNTIPDTKISSWLQSSDTNVTIRSGIPDVSLNDQIRLFINPLPIISADGKNEENLYFQNVEPFVIPISVFYLTISGRAHMTAEPASLDQSLIQTVRPSTTGLLTSVARQGDKDKLVRFTKSSGSSGGLSGVNAMVSLRNNGFVSANFTFGSDDAYQQYLLFSTKATINKLVDELLIESMGANYYYVQYFRYENGGNNDPGMTTQNTLETTTTKSGSKVFSVLFMFIALIF